MLGTEKTAGQVCINNFLPQCERTFVKWSIFRCACHIAGIVDKNIDSAGFCQYFLHSVLNFLLIADIQCHADGLLAGIFGNKLCRFSGTVGRSACNDYICSCFSQCQCHVKTQIPGSPSDKGPFAVQTEQLHHVPAGIVFLAHFRNPSFYLFFIRYEYLDRTDAHPAGYLFLLFHKNEQKVLIILAIYFKNRNTMTSQKQ